MTFKEIDKYYNKKRELKKACYCGHKVFINPKKGYAICDYCGRKVANEKYKFREKIKKIMKEGNENERKNII